MKQKGIRGGGRLLFYPRSSPGARVLMTLSHLLLVPSLKPPGALLSEEFISCGFVVKRK